MSSPAVNVRGKVEDVHKVFKRVCGPDSVGAVGMYGTVNHSSLSEVITELDVEGKNFYDGGCGAHKPGFVALQKGAKSATGNELPQNELAYGVHQDAVRNALLDGKGLEWYNFFSRSVVFSHV